VPQYDTLPAIVPVVRVLVQTQDLVVALSHVDLTAPPTPHPSRPEILAACRKAAEKKESGLVHVNGDANCSIKAICGLDINGLHYGFSCTTTCLDGRSVWWLSSAPT
jgi:hypothetical protein